MLSGSSICALQIYAADLEHTDTAVLHLGKSHQKRN